MILRVFEQVAGAGGLAVMAAACLAILWALFADRSRGRRRCCRCWYDMKGTPGLTCPECGRVHRGERDLLRTRRRWRRALVLLLPVFVVLYARLAESRVRDRGWPGAIPTPVLMAAAPGLKWDFRGAAASWSKWGAPWGPPPVIPLRVGAQLSEELEKRLRGGEVWWWQRRLFQRACAAFAVGDVRRGEFVTDSWALSWLHVSQNGAAPSVWPVRSYLASLVPGAVHAPARWCAGHPFRLTSTLESIPCVPGNFIVEVFEGRERIGVGRFTPTITVAGLSAGVHTLTVRASLVEFGAGGDPPDRPELWSTSFRLRVEVAPRVDDVRRRWATEALADAIPRFLTVESGLGAGGVEIRLSVRDDGLNPTAGAAPLPAMNLAVRAGAAADVMTWPSKWAALAPVHADPWTLKGGVWSTTLPTGLTPAEFAALGPVVLEFTGGAELALSREEYRSFWEGTMIFEADPRLGCMALRPGPPEGP